MHINPSVEVRKAAEALAEAIQQSAGENGYAQAFADIAHAFQVVGDTATDLVEHGHLAVSSLVYDGVADHAVNAADGAADVAKRLAQQLTSNGRHLLPVGASTGGW